MRIPDMTFPIDNGVPRYDRLVKVAHAARLMSDYGVRIDLGRAAWHLENAKQRAGFFLRKFLELTGLSESDMGAKGSGQTNIVRDWFWVRNEAPVLSRHRRTKAPQFNTATLIGYANDYAQSEFGPAAAALYGIRASRTAARFAEAYLRVGRHCDGRIKFGFNVLGTKGERWSASQKFAWWDAEKESWLQYSLNAQNVPSREPKFPFEGQEMKMALSMRDIFIPDAGCVFWKADYEGLEGQLIACITGAKRLLGWLDGGLDLHIENARVFFGEKRVPEGACKKMSDDVDILRECAKPLMYGFSYQTRNDRGDDEYPEAYKTLKKSLPNMTMSGVQRLAERFFEHHPEIAAFQQQIKEQIASVGKVTLGLNGAFLYLPNIPRGWNQAINFNMQSSGGYLINRATVSLCDRVDWDKPNTTAPLLQVHDELAGQVEECRIEEWAQEVESAMSEPAEFPHITKGVPCKVLVGQSWGAVASRKSA
jgi:hypothetical protein